MLCGGICNVLYLYYDCSQAFSEDFVTKLPSMIKRSAFGSEQAEGVYLRFEKNDYVLERAKLRRATFTAGRTDFETSVKNNTLLNK